MIDQPFSGSSFEGLTKFFVVTLQKHILYLEGDLSRHLFHLFVSRSIVQPVMPDKLTRLASFLWLFSKASRSLCILLKLLAEEGDRLGRFEIALGTA